MRVTQIPMVMHCNCVWSWLWQYKVKQLACLGLTSCSIFSLALNFIVFFFFSNTGVLEVQRKRWLGQAQSVGWLKYADSVAGVWRSEIPLPNPYKNLQAGISLFINNDHSPSLSRENLLQFPVLGESQELTGIGGAVGCGVLTCVHFSHFSF